jgi:hypothetical protein
MKSIGYQVKGLNDDACCECGRKVGKNPFYVHLTIGAEILPIESDSKESQGFWAVGSECAKQFDPAVLTRIQN